MRSCGCPRIALAEAKRRRCWKSDLRIGRRPINKVDLTPLVNEDAFYKRRHMQFVLHFEHVAADCFLQRHPYFCFGKIVILVKKALIANRVFFKSCPEVFIRQVL